MAQTVAPLLVAAATLTTNIVIALAITLRIMYHLRYIRIAIGSSHTSVYAQVITISVESCMLIAVGSAAHIDLSLTGHQYQEITLQLLPQLCVSFSSTLGRFYSMNAPNLGDLPTFDHHARSKG